MRKFCVSIFLSPVTLLPNNEFQTGDRPPGVLARSQGNPLKIVHFLIKHFYLFSNLFYRSKPRHYWAKPK